MWAIIVVIVIVIFFNLAAVTRRLRQVNTRDVSPVSRRRAVFSGLPSSKFVSSIGSKVHFSRSLSKSLLTRDISLTTVEIV